MASRSKSRWADEEDESAEAVAQRKREKEEKKRAKEEKLQKLREQEEAQAKAQVASAAVEVEDSEDQATRPSKRRRLSHKDQPAEPRLLRFPTKHFEACGNFESYERLNDIEEGSYGWVSRARDNRSGQIVALKKLKMDYVSDGFPVTGLREIQTLRACQHPNIVPLLDVAVGPTLKE